MKKNDDSVSIDDLVLSAERCFVRKRFRKVLSLSDQATQLLKSNHDKEKLLSEDGDITSDDDKDDVHSRSHHNGSCTAHFIFPIKNPLGFIMSSYSRHNQQETVSKKLISSPHHHEKRNTYWNVRISGATSTNQTNLDRLTNITLQSSYEIWKKSRKKKSLWKATDPDDSDTWSFFHTAHRILQIYTHYETDCDTITKINDYSMHLDLVIIAIQYNHSLGFDPRGTIKSALQTLMNIIFILPSMQRKSIGALYDPLMKLFYIIFVDILPRIEDHTITTNILMLFVEKVNDFIKSINNGREMDDSNMLTLDWQISSVKMTEKPNIQSVDEILESFSKIKKTLPETKNTSPDMKYYFLLLGINMSQEKLKKLGKSLPYDENMISNDKKAKSNTIKTDMLSKDNERKIEANLRPLARLKFSVQRIASNILSKKQGIDNSYLAIALIISFLLWKKRIHLFKRTRTLAYAILITPLKEIIEAILPSAES